MCKKKVICLMEITFLMKILSFSLVGDTKCGSVEWRMEFVEFNLCSNDVWE